MLSSSSATAVAHKRHAPPPAALCPRRNPGKKLFVLGESMGGSLVLRALLKGALRQPVAGVVLTGPLVRSCEDEAAHGSSCPSTCPTPSTTA